MAMVSYPSLYGENLETQDALLGSDSQHPNVDFPMEHSGFMNKNSNQGIWLQLALAFGTMG